MNYNYKECMNIIISMPTYTPICDYMLFAEHHYDVKNNGLGMPTYSHLCSICSP